MWFHGLYSYLQWVRFITLFPNNVFLLLLHVERVCKSFWQESWRVQVAHLHNEARALSSRSRCFQLSTNLKAKISFVIFTLWYKTNRMWLSLVCILIDNDTGHQSRQDLLWNQWFIHACRHKQNFHGNLRWLNRDIQDHEARASDLNRKLIFSFFLLFS